MAPPKRKRKPTRCTANKRPKYTHPDTDSSSDEEPPANDSQIEWEALRILDQRGRGFGLKYKIEWKGVDPATGKQWEPTWERASNAGESLVASWRRYKQEEAWKLQEGKDTTVNAESSTPQRSAPVPPQTQATQAPITRNRRVIESSPEPSTEQLAIESPEGISQGAIAASDTAIIDIDAPITGWPLSQANINLRDNSPKRGEHELYAEIPESQPSPAKSNTDDTDLDSSQLFALQRAFRASGIVPDTQSSAGDVGYIPVTQEELDSSQNSESIDESTEQNIIGYSGLLEADTAPRLGARAQSPATSIAETVPDTTQDLQSQRQPESQEGQLQTPETIESPHDTAKSNQIITQNDTAVNHHTDTAPAQTQSPENRHQLSSQEQVAFIENTTQSDYDKSSRDLELPEHEQGESSAPAEVTQESIKNTTQATASSAKSEALVVIDTPQISQLTSTVQEGATNEDYASGVQTSTTPLSEIVHRSAGDESDFSLTERTVLEENAQFPYRSQYSASFNCNSATKTPQRAFTEPPRTLITHKNTGARFSEGPNQSIKHESGTLSESEESTTIDEATQSLVGLQSNLSAGARSQQTTLRRDASKAGHESSALLRLTVPRLQQLQADLQDSEHTTITATEGVVERAGYVLVSQPLPSTQQSTGLHGHNAQLVALGACLSTQEDTTEGIRVTIETDPIGEQASKYKSSPSSRHDSSQETPERRFQSVEHSSSPIPQLPSFSLKTIDSHVPPRPVTPTLSSSRSKMTESTSAQVERQIKEMKEAARAARPFIPRRQRIRASQPSSPAPTSAAIAGSPLQPNKAHAPPTINISAEGTRSPSTVPDRSPAPPAPTSLRTVTFADAKDKTTEALLENPLAATASTTDAGPTQEKAELVAAVAAVAAPFKQTAPPVILHEDDDEELSDADSGVSDDDDNESLIEDDLQLESEEYVVPLSLDGRQCDMYTLYIKEKADALDAYVSVPDGFDSLIKVEEVLAYLRAVETHPDLIYAEAESATGLQMRSPTQVQQEAQFGIENSIKFKFLQQLFGLLREQDLHAVLLLNRDDNALFNILRTFFAATFLNYNMPTKGFQANVMETNGALAVTVFPDSASPIIRPADLIICLDGVQNAAKIRQSNWASASGKTVPVLHLVISRTVGHIERYISSTLDRRDRIETTLHCLGQFQNNGDIGKPIDLDLPDASEAARLVADWINPKDDNDGLGWPLPSIGSVKDVLEYQTQRSVASAASSPAPERTKRPLEADDLDPAKRMRLTPQPRLVPNSSINREQEVTRVSDSMPGTAVSENACLVDQLEKIHTALLEKEKEFRDERVMWDKQQTEYENRADDYRRLFGEKAEIERAHESMTRNRDKLRTQLDAQAIEIKSLRDELEAQRMLGLESTDEKDVEITRLRKELEAAFLERDKALKSVQSTEATLEYTKEQYRIASNTAGQLQTDVTSLQARNAKLAHQASGEVAKLKQMHLDKSAKNLLEQNRALMTQNNNMTVLLRQKEEELIRAKSNNGRMGYGTRAHSTTPQPKTRSRAASPMGGRGGRIDRMMREG